MPSVFDDFDRQYKDSFSEHVLTLPLGGQIITFRAMRQGEVKAILKAVESGDTYLMNKTFDEVLNKIIVDADASVPSMYLKDRALLLAWAKCVSTDGKISMSGNRCRTCGEEVSGVSPDLETWEKTVFDVPSVVFEHVIQIDTPMGSFKLKVGAPRREDEIEQDKFIKRNMKNEEPSMVAEGLLSECLLFKGLAKCGEEDVFEPFPTFDQRVQFFDVLRDEDKKKIDDYLNVLGEAMPTIPFQIKCDECDDKYVEELQPSDFFYRT